MGHTMTKPSREYAHREDSDQPFELYISDCLSLCNETLNVKAVTCDDKTMECKYTCNQGHGGDHCQYECDNNCLKCGSTLV